MAAAAVTSAVSTARPRVLLGVTGSVAAVKGPRLALRLAARGCDVRVVLTGRGDHFWRLAEGYDAESWAALAGVPGAHPGGVAVSEDLVRAMAVPAGAAEAAGAPLRAGDTADAAGKASPGGAASEPSRAHSSGAGAPRAPQGPGRVEAVLRDDDEWETFRAVKADPVLHIELRRWADALVIAPLSANTLGKLAHGMCDDLLSCVFRAWEQGRPILACPAMNTLMWEHPYTARDLGTLRGLPCVSVVGPAEALLACGDKGAGALADVDAIAAETMRRLGHDDA